MVDVLQSGIGIAVEERLGGHDEAGRAEAALLGVVLHERGLEGIELVAVAEALHRMDGGELEGDRQQAARIDRIAVDQHRAGAAGAAVADPLGTRQLQMIAQGVEQRRPRLEHQVHGLVVDPQPHRDRSRPPDLHPALQPRRMRILLRRLQHLPGEQSRAAEGAHRRAAAQEVAPGEALATRGLRGRGRRRRMITLAVTGHSPPPSELKLACEKVPQGGGAGG